MTATHARGLVPHRNTLVDGTVLFVELAIGETRLLLSEEAPQLNALSPTTIGGTPMLLTLETDDPDDLLRRAVFAGCGLIGGLRLYPIWIQSARSPG